MTSKVSYIMQKHILARLRNAHGGTCLCVSCLKNIKIGDKVSSCKNKYGRNIWHAICLENKYL